MNTWYDDKDLADSYMKLVMMLHLPNARLCNDKSSIRYYERKIKEYESKWGTYPEKERPVGGELK